MLMSFIEQTGLYLGTIQSNLACNFFIIRYIIIEGEQTGLTIKQTSYILFVFFIQREIHDVMPMVHFKTLQ